MKIQRFAHRFVDHFPEPLEEGVLYVSLEFASVAHACACGCGREVITPLSPAAWKFTFDGETVSLDHSVGNWSFPCRSHYWIEGSVVRWSYDMSPAEIADVRAYAQAARDQHYESANESSASKAAPVLSESPIVVLPHEKERLWTRFKSWLGGG